MVKSLPDAALDLYVPFSQIFSSAPAFTIGFLIKFNVIVACVEELQLAGVLEAVNVNITEPLIKSACVGMYELDIAVLDGDGFDILPLPSCSHSNES